MRFAGDGAIRLSKAFGSSPEVRAGLQLDYDMARALRNADRIRVERIKTLVDAE
jgi:plasmid maintenance system antidote protein VapI